MMQPFQRSSSGVRLPFLNKLKQYLLVLGIPGLFLIALLDSAAIPLTGGPDAVVLLLSWKRPGVIWLIVAAAAAGSTLGCLVLYKIGSAGGELALSRFSEARRAWVREKLDRNAFWAVFAAVTMPPPFPTKPVILASGVFKMRLDRFLVGVLAGRLLRYGVEAYLGARFGERAAALLQGRFSLVLLGIVAAVLSLAILLRRRRKLPEAQPGRGKTES
jgi:membrane protein YqaA with SNARE-associated domain